jgi:hypothetical protein
MRYADLQTNLCGASCFAMCLPTPNMQTCCHVRCALPLLCSFPYTAMYFSFPATLHGSCCSPILFFRRLHFLLVDALPHHLACRLLLLNFYPFLQRYVAPHTRDVPQVLAALVGAVHELVPPDMLSPVLRQLVDQFVHDRCDGALWSSNCAFPEAISSKTASWLTGQFILVLSWTVNMCWHRHRRVAL